MMNNTIKEMMNTKGTIYFDMDGTLANFYGVENWLAYLEKEDTTPYKVAKPLFNFSAFARVLHKLQANGYRMYLDAKGNPDGWTIDKMEVHKKEMYELLKSTYSSEVKQIIWNKI